MTTTDPDERELRELALEQIRRRRRFALILSLYLVTLPVLTAVWAITEYQNAGDWPTALRTGRRDHDWDPWIVYPVLLMTLWVAVQGWMTHRQGPVTEREVQDEMRRLAGPQPR